MVKKFHISSPLFKKILQSVPLSTVDLVVVRGAGKNREFLLGRRTNKPYRGNWFIPGGRTLWGETLENAVKRHLKSELGTRPGHVKFLFHFCWNNPPGNLGVRYYTIYHVYVAELGKKAKLKPNSENKQLGWFKKIDPAWPLPVREILKHAGFK